MKSDGPDATETLVLPPPLLPQPVRSSSLEVKEDVLIDSDVAVEAAELTEDISSHGTVSLHLHP